jgi:hypothetical protein
VLDRAGLEGRTASRTPIARSQSTFWISEPVRATSPTFAASSVTAAWVSTGPAFFPFWDRLHRWLGLHEVVEHAIRTRKKLSPEIGRFDLVTAYRCQFNYNQAEGRLWNIDEWNFFLDDLRDNVLRPGARFAIKLTRQEDKGSAGLKRDYPAIIELFAERGARETGKVLVFDPLM